MLIRVRVTELLGAGSPVVPGNAGQAQSLPVILGVGASSRAA